MTHFFANHRRWDFAEARLLQRRMRGNERREQVSPENRGESSLVERANRRTRMPYRFNELQNSPVFDTIGDVARHEAIANGYVPYGRRRGRRGRSRYQPAAAPTPVTPPAPRLRVESVPPTPRPPVVPPRVETPPPPITRPPVPPRTIQAENVAAAPPRAEVATPPPRASEVVAPTPPPTTGLERPRADAVSTYSAPILSGPTHRPMELPTYLRPQSSSEYQVIGEPDEYDRKWIASEVHYVGNNVLHPNFSILRHSIMLNDSQRKFFAQFVNKNDPMMTFKKFDGAANSGNEFGFVVAATARGIAGKWNILISAADPESVVLRRSDDILTQTSAPKNELFNGTNVNFQKAKQFMEEAARDRESGKRDEAQIEAFDLPKDRKIGYLGLLDARDSWEAHQLRSWPRFLTSAGYQMVASGNYVEQVMRDPLAIIREKFGALLRQVPPVKDFYLSLTPHGSKNGKMVFSLPGYGKYELAPQALISCLMEFPADCHFALDVNSCFSGGTQLADLTDIKGAAGSRRITLFMQSSERIPTPTVGRTFEGKASTLYNSLLMYYMAPPRNLSMGRAHLAARDDINRIQPGLQPRAHVSSRDGTLRTAELSPLPNLTDELLGRGGASMV